MARTASIPSCRCPPEFRSGRWQSASPGRSMPGCLPPRSWRRRTRPSPTALRRGEKRRRTRWRSVLRMNPLTKVEPGEGALPPGSTIGILGGGQLGRMLAIAAARLGFRCHIFCPDPESPAFDVSAEKTVAAYTDAAALDAFARAVNVVTYEFENVEVAAVEQIAAIVPVRPGARPLVLSQARITEKS